MMIAALRSLALAAALQSDTALPPAGTPLVRPLPAGATISHEAADDTTPRRRRPRAVELSDGYARRLTLHRWGGYAMFPLYGVQAVLGQQMYNQKQDLRTGKRVEPIDHGLRVAHRATAIGMSAVFAANTVTGVWNLYEARGVEDQRALRFSHTILMLAADAGLVASSVMGRRHETHRTIAIGSMSVAAVSSAMMLVLNRD